MSGFLLAHVIEDFGAELVAGSGVATWPLGAAPSGSIKNVVLTFEAGSTAGTPIIRFQILHPLNKTRRKEEILLLEDVFVEDYAKELIIHGTGGVRGFLWPLYLSARLLSGLTTDLGRAAVTLYIEDDDPFQRAMEAEGD
jgi:hypothetical protein